MHAKHRNGPGNGYRSNALGMGMGNVAAASRIPPEGSVRGNRNFNTEYRSYSRGGYGGGVQSKQFQPPLPPPREADIFMEAGRLAAEYLVSKGVLPPNSISGKWQNDSSKNQVGNFQGFRAHEIENIPMSADSQSRMGNAPLDRRRYSDEFNSMGSRNSIRGGRKRAGSFQSYGSEMNKELGRSVSWAGKVRASTPMEADNDTSAGKDGSSGIQNSSPGETTQEVTGIYTESGLEKRDLVEDVDGKDSTMSDDKCLPLDAGETNKKSDDADKINDKDLQQKHDENKANTSSVMNDGVVSEDLVDLVQHCKFANVPTKTRSSLKAKGTKNDVPRTEEDDHISKSKLLEDSGVHVIDVDVDNSVVSASSHQNHENKSLQSNVPLLENEMDATYSTRPGSSNSVAMERVEKRAINFNTDDREDFKKLRQWVPSVDGQADSSSTISSLMKPILQEPRNSHSSHMTQSSDQNSLDVSLFPIDHADSGQFMEVKQFFPGSFKTCDLNLVGASDANENHDADPMLVFSSISQTGQVKPPIDVDLSMSNNGNVPTRNGKHVVNDKDIEVIDLEKDSAIEDEICHNSERRGDAVFTDLDGFSSNVHNANGIPDVQDGYGLMISELLGNDSSNCSVTGLNSLHSMGLPSTEGILADDDPIYMSLGEIPISLLGPWEQQSQDYTKPF